jgi:hypothetical protein
MKKTLKPKKLTLDKTTLRTLTTTDLQDVAGGTSGACTLTCVTNGCAGTNNSCDVCHEN